MAVASKNVLVPVANGSEEIETVHSSVSGAIEAAQFLCLGVLAACAANALCQMIVPCVAIVNRCLQVDCLSYLGSQVTIVDVLRRAGADVTLASVEEGLQVI